MMFHRTSIASFLRCVVIMSIVLLSCGSAPLTAEADAANAMPSSGRDDKATLLDPSVIELTSVAFSTTIGDGNVWLLEFYSPSCRHCREFANSYAKIASAFHSAPNEGIRVAKVDISRERALRTRFSVRSVPTFFVVDGWSVYVYDGYYNEAKLTEFVRGGYELQDPIPLLLSPMGPIGQLQGITIVVGDLLLTLFGSVQDSFGLSAVSAAIVVAFAAFFVGMAGVILLFIISWPKAKQE